MYFNTVGKSLSHECTTNADIMHGTCKIAGVLEKSEGPTTCITFLGIEVDSVAMELRLPADKLLRLQQLSSQWQGKRHAKGNSYTCLQGS